MEIRNPQIYGHGIYDMDERGNRRERESRAETASPCAQASGRPCSCLLHLLPLPQGLPWRSGGVGQGRRGRQSRAGQGREARSLRGLLQRTAAAARSGRGCRAGAAHDAERRKVRREGGAEQTLEAGGGAREKGREKRRAVGLPRGPRSPAGLQVDFEII